MWRIVARERKERGPMGAVAERGALGAAQAGPGTGAFSAWCPSCGWRCPSSTRSGAAVFAEHHRELYSGCAPTVVAVGRDR